MCAVELAAQRVWLVGRRAETRLLGSVAKRAIRGEGGAVVVRGEAGIGKTALIDHVAAAASMHTLRVCPAEPEKAMPYAALADLLSPLHEHVERIPVAHKAALDVGLALRCGAPPDLGILTSATYGVLSAAAAEQPILVLVDDAQWLDPPSRHVLAAVAAHLAPDPMLMIIAVRSRGDEDPGLGGITSIALGALPAAAGRALVRARCAGLTSAQAARIVSDRGGNPRQLLASADLAHRDGTELGRPHSTIRAASGQPAAPPPAGGPSSRSGELEAVFDALTVWRAEPVVDLEIVRSWAMTWAGHPRRAVGDLMRAAEAIQGTDARRAADLYLEAALPAAIAGRVQDMLALARRAVALSTFSVEPAAAATTSAAALVLSGATEDARARLGEALEGATQPPERWTVRTAVLYAQTRMWLEEHAEAERVLAPVIERVRADGPPGWLPYALAVRAELAWWTGKWAAAQRYATEGLRSAEQLGQVAGVGFALVTLARVEMGRGERAAGQRLAERALRETGPYGIDSCRPYVDAVLGLGSLAAGDALAATEHLEQARCVAERCGLSAPGVVGFGGDLVEAHIRAGRDARAKETLDWLDGQAASGLVLPAAAAARCRGLMTDDLDRAGELFALAKSLPGRRELPFERGRTLLCEGETLRRLRRPALARRALDEALGLFTDLGSRPWAARAEREIASTGDKPGVWPEVGLGDLTPRERQIATIVADGRSNAGAASALLISRRTVEAHLNRIYSKLGVRSRTELARKVASLSASSAGRT